MSIEDRDWYREHMKAKRTPVAAAPKPPAKRRSRLSRYLPPMLIGLVIYFLLRFIFKGFA